MPEISISSSRVVVNKDKKEKYQKVKRLFDEED